MATRCEKMLGQDYMRRHNAIVKCIHLLLCNKHNIAIGNKKLRGYFVQQIVANKYVEIRVDTTIKTDVKIRYNKPDILLIDKIKKELLIVEIGVTSLDNLQQVESEKFRKYDELANELGLIHGCKTKIIPYVITWDGIVSKYHSKHRKELGITDRIEAYIQSTTLIKNLESISMEYRRGERIAETEEADQQTNVFQGQILV
ncbi:reverse transcriptase [Vairimorpha apis BRL 01]|nr:reverse transcriptase [Vairimorpha apis BRL 01]